MDSEQGHARPESETSADTTGPGGMKASRRALLKGAVAAGVGVAVYSAPVVSTVPAYAQTGLQTISAQTSDICFGFSPQHQSMIGDWHIPAAVANVFNPGIYSDHDNAPSTATISVQIMVPPGPGGTWRTLELGGNFNNWDGTTSGNYTVAGWNGGGIFLNLLDSNCQLRIINWYRGTTNAAQNCTIAAPAAPNQMFSSFNPIDSGGTNPGTAPPNNVPNPFIGGGGPKYFHSGRPRKGNAANMDDWVGGIRFRIECKS